LLKAHPPRVDPNAEILKLPDMLWTTGGGIFTVEMVGIIIAILMIGNATSVIRFPGKFQLKSLREQPLSTPWNNLEENR